MTSITATNAIYKYTKFVAQTAYIFGFPAVVQYIAMTNDLVEKAPMNTMYYATGISTPTYSPFLNGGQSSDMLYATAWLDLKNTNIILKTPDTRMATRWYTVQLLDAFSNVIKNVPGDDKRRKSRKYLIVGPNSILTESSPNVPDDVKLIKCSSNIVYLVGRIVVKGINDLSAATAIMNEITILETNPGAAVLEPAQLSTSVYTSLNFFASLMNIINYNSYSIEEKVMINLFKGIGLDPTKSFVPSALNTNLQNAFNDAISTAYNLIIPFGYQYAQGTININNWIGSTKLGIWDNDYLRRAYSATEGVAANVVTEQFYATTSKDISGNTLDATINNYKIHFETSQLPSLNPDWGYFSITLYENTNNGLQFYDNQNNIYSVGTHTGTLQYNVDGTLDIYIQNNAPSNETNAINNWIPAPLGPFYLKYRLYSPTFIGISQFVAPGVEINN